MPKMTAKTFTNTRGGLWETGSNWTPAGRPVSTDDAFINVAFGSYTVTIDTPTQVNTVTLNAPTAVLEISGFPSTNGELILNSKVALETGTLDLEDGQITGGTIVNTGVSLVSLVATVGTLDGVTWQGALGED